jgi:ParB family transcriptional regulator, chromosome partitioning protein
MAIKKRGLGRGLDALLGATRSDPQDTEDSAAAPGEDSIPHTATAILPLEAITRGRYQPRRDFDPQSLQELADSISAQGVLQPIVVRPIASGRYEIVAGERRWRAAQIAGLSDLPAVIKDVDEQTAMAMGLIENIQRDDLNPLEEATALSRLLTEFDLTHQEVARAVGKSRTTVTNLLRLLDLAPDVKGYLETSEIEMGHARALLGLKGEQQSEAARQVVSRGLSVRETEKLVRREQLKAEADTPTRPAREPDPDVRRLQTDLSERLGTQVHIQQGNRGCGRLVIAYNSLDELDGILAHIH